MSRKAPVLAGALLAFDIALMIGAIWFAAATPSGKLPPDQRASLSLVFIFPITLLVLGAVGAVCASLRPKNSVGWLLLTSSIVGSAVGCFRFYGQYAVSTWAVPPPEAAWIAWLASWLWIPWLALQAFWLPLLFPDGRLPQWPWSIVAFVGTGATFLAALGAAVDPHLMPSPAPAGPISLPIGPILWAAGLSVLAACSVASVASVFVRLRGAGSELQLQMKCLAGGVGLLLSSLLIAGSIHSLLPPNSLVIPLIIAAGYLAVPASVGVAILRFHLYDVDIVINRSIVFGILAVFVTAVYVAVVFGIGSLIGLAGSPWLSLAATALAALAFQPARSRAQRAVERLVHGRRTAPYLALAELARRGASDPMSEELLKDMGRMAAEGTGALNADIWLRTGEEMQLAASWPESKSLGPCTLKTIPGNIVQPVLHEASAIGAISIFLASGIGLRPAELQLLRDIAAQAGILLNNRRLTFELMKRVDELRESRRRLVNAQDTERRRFERDLHDGAQQQLYALKLGLRQARIESDNGRSHVLEALEVAAESALQSVKELARGVFPPLLTAQGLQAALSARARSSPVETTVSAEVIGRYSPEIEGAVYFCCLEALQNAVAHAHPSSVRIELKQWHEELSFTVTDDGEGISPKASADGSGLQNIRDRLDVYGGRVEIRSGPGQGTTLTGFVPAEPIAV